MDHGELCLFALASSREFGENLGRALGAPLAAHEEREFEDGEHKARPLVGVRGKDVFVVQSLHGDGEQSVNDKLCRLLFFLSTLADASAARITAVVPYLCYARKDRRTQPRDPVTTRYVARLFEAAGADRVLTIDVHNAAAFENAFRCPTEHLEATRLFVDHFARRLADEEIVVVSPDAGGVKRAERFRQALAATLGRPVATAFVEKHRSHGVLSGEAVVGEVGGRTVIIIDDLISTGGTMVRAASACLKLGATRVFAAATHGAFAAGAEAKLADPALAGIVVTDTVAPFRLGPGPLADKLTVIATDRLFADAVRAIHNDGSINDLLRI